MTREESHVLLDAVLDANESQKRYDIGCTFQNNYDGTLMASIYVYDNYFDKNILKAQNKTGIIKSFIVSKYSETVWDAIKEIANYKVGGDSK